MAFWLDLALRFERLTFKASASAFGYDETEFAESFQAFLNENTMSAKELMSSCDNRLAKEMKMPWEVS